MVSMFKYFICKTTSDSIVCDIHTHLSLPRKVISSIRAHYIHVRNQQMISISTQSNRIYILIYTGMSIVNGNKYYKSEERVIPLNNKMVIVCGFCFSFVQLRMQSFCKHFDNEMNGEYVIVIASHSCLLLGGHLFVG